jgi:hypothetical protein
LFTHLESPDPIFNPSSEAVPQSALQQEKRRVAAERPDMKHPQLLKIAHEPPTRCNVSKIAHETLYKCNVTKIAHETLYKCNVTKIAHETLYKCNVTKIAHEPCTRCNVM